MTLHPDWKLILRRAWSIRFIALAGAGSFIEGTLQAYLSGISPSALLNIAIGVASAAAAVARIVAQRNMPDGT